MSKKNPDFSSIPKKEEVDNKVLSEAQRKIGSDESGGRLFTNLSNIFKTNKSKIYVARDEDESLIGNIEPVGDDSAKVIPVVTKSQIASVKSQKKITIKDPNKKTWGSFFKGVFGIENQVLSLAGPDVNEDEVVVKVGVEKVPLSAKEGSLVIKSDSSDYKLALAVSGLSKNYVNESYKVTCDEQVSTTSVLSRFRTPKVSSSVFNVRVDHVGQKKSAVAPAVDPDAAEFVTHLKTFFAKAENVEKLIKEKGERGKEKEVLEAYAAAGGKLNELDVFKLFSDSEEEKISDVNHILNLINPGENSESKLKFLREKLKTITNATGLISIKEISAEYEKQIAEKAKEIDSSLVLVDNDSSSENERGEAPIRKVKSRIKRTTATVGGQDQAALLASQQFVKTLIEQAIIKVAAERVALTDNEVSLGEPLVSGLVPAVKVAQNVVDGTGRSQDDDRPVSDGDSSSENDDNDSIAGSDVSGDEDDDQSISDGDSSSEDNNNNNNNSIGGDEETYEFEESESGMFSDKGSEFDDSGGGDLRGSVGEPEEERGRLNLDSSKRDAAIKVFFERNKVVGDEFRTVNIEGVEGVSFVIKKAEGEENKFSVFEIKQDGNGDEVEVELTAANDLEKAVNNLGRKLIFDAAQKGDELYLRACLDVGVSLSEKDAQYGATPLHWAANGSKKDACEFLVKEGADIFAMDNEFFTALAVGRDEAKDFLSKKREEVCRHYYDEFSPSAEKRNEVLKAFYDQLPDVGGVPQRQFSDRDGFEYLIKKNGTDYSIVGFNDSGGEVAETSKWKIGYALNDLGKKKAIFNAVRGRDEKLVQACLDVGVSANQKFDDGFPILFEAAYFGKKEVCKLLIASGADIFRMDAQGKTALFHAREGGDEETIKFLLAESAKKPNLPNLKVERQNAVLQNFFGADETIPEKEIYGSEGEYSITKDGENYSVSVLVKNTAGGLGSLVQKLEEKDLSAAIGDLGRRLIFNAARSGDVELFKACLEAGASVDAADEKGNKPLFYAQQNPANKEIANLISERKKDPKTKKGTEPKDKFRELAALVRDAHLAGGNVQEVIAQFGQNNPDFKIGGLKAEDMTVFMKDISIKKDDNTPDLNIKPATKNPSSGGAENFSVQSLLNGRSIDDGNESNGEEIKAFYQKLLITCLEDEHRFISDEDTHNIRNLIAERAKGKKPDHDIGYSALNSVDKDSVAGLYMRASFEELKEREGLNENLTYEDFSRKLGDVVKINSKLDKERFEGDIEVREKELEALKKELEDLENPADERDEAKIELKKAKIKLETEYLEAFKRRKDNPKYADSLDQNTRALNALLGSGDEKADKNLDRRAPHRDLRLTLNMMKDEVEFTPAKILENRELEEQAAAIKLQAFSRGLSSRRRIADVREGEKVVLDVKRIAEFDLEESFTSFEMSDNFLIEADNSEHKIKEVQGEKIYNGNTGLVIHEFSGLDGLSDFTDQVEEANKREGVGSNFTSEVSIAHIKDLPTDSGGVKNSFCIAVLSDVGATKIFSKKFDEITKRSSDLYEENIKFETDRAGIEAAIVFLTEARNGTLLGNIVDQATGDKVILDPGSIIALSATRQAYSNQLAGLRKCLRGSEPDSNDSPEQKEIKRQDLQSRLVTFNKSPEGLNFKKLLENKNERGEGISVLSSKNIDVINKLLAGESTEEMKNRARQNTSRQMKSEIAGRVQSSMRNNEHKFNLDGLEVAEAVAKYQNQSLTQFSNIADNSWLGNGRGQKGFEGLLKEKMPSSAYEGISVFRPRGEDNIATVTFNGAYSGDDTMYLALPDSPQCYIRVSRCDKDGPVSVWRDGKRVKEDHKKGDVLIDTGVVFHRGDDGKYERNPIHLDALEGRFGKGVKEAALDFKVKAISVNDGQRLSSAMLYNGKGIALELKAKSSPFREVDSHKPEANPEVDKLRRNAEVIFELVGGKAKASDLEVLDIEIGTNARLVIGKKDEDSKLVTGATGVETETPLLKSGDIVNTSEDFKANLKTTLKRATKEEVIKFLDKFFKDGSSKKDELINSWNNKQFDEVVNEIAGSIGSIRAQKLEDINKKYAVIDASKNVNLVIPVVLDDDVAKPKFSFPEIQLLDGTELKQIKIFDDKGKIDEKTKAQIIEKADLEFVRKFFSADEMKGKTAKEFLGTNYENLCDEMKKRCETAKVTVAFQKVVADGTHEGKPKYKSEGEKSFETFQRDLEDSKNIKSVEGEKASSKSFLLNKLLGRPTFSSNPKNTGRGS